MSDEFLAESRERVRRLTDDMAAPERAAWIAKIMAGAALHDGPLPRDLMDAVYATIDALAADPPPDPAALAIEAFRRHGFRAALVDRGDVALLRVEPLG